MTINDIILADMLQGFGVGLAVWFMSYWISRIFAFFKWFTT